MKNDVGSHPVTQRRPVADAQTCTDRLHTFRCTMPNVPPCPRNQLHMQIRWGGRASTTMGASIRRFVATHGYRIPHNLATWAHIHRFRVWSIPWEQPIVVRLDTPIMRHAKSGRWLLTHPCCGVMPFKGIKLATHTRVIYLFNIIFIFYYIFMIF